MDLERFIAALGVDEIVNTSSDGGADVLDVAYDTRDVEPGTLFFCVRGTTRDGHAFAATAAALGAVDAELIREGRIVDLRRGGYPRVERKPQASSSLDPARAAAIVDTVLATVATAAGSR